jgi:hypothetical protein
LNIHNIQTKKSENIFRLNSILSKMGVENRLLVGLNLVVHLLRVDRSIEDNVLRVHSLHGQRKEDTPTDPPAIELEIE